MCRVFFTLLVANLLARGAWAGPQSITTDSNLPGAEFHIYLGNTHAHTIFTASHGEQLVKDKNQKAEPPLQIDAGGVQRHAKGHNLKPDWAKYQGTPAEHFARARTNGYNFYITTDHSQEETFAPTSPTNASWVATKQQARAATDPDFVALAGYEHSENNGPGGKGHLNVINSAEYLNALAPGIDLSYLYRWLEKASPNGEGPIVASFNHPGRTSYNDWADRDPKITEIITLLEVINGNSRIHYDGFVRALDKGWKVSPVCGLDNHGYWGISHHTSATFVLATNKTKTAILEAMRHRRTYAAMDTNLDCRYTVNGKIMGTTLDRPERFTFDVAIRDLVPADAKSKISKIEILKEGGVVAETHRADPPAYEVRWRATLTDVTNKYYFVRVWSTGTEGVESAKTEKPIAWLAPVWTGR